MFLAGVVVVGFIASGLADEPVVASWMREAGQRARTLAAVVIFVITYFAVGVGRLPGFRTLITLMAGILWLTFN